MGGGERRGGGTAAGGAEGGGLGSWDRRSFLETFLKGAGCFAVTASLPFAGACRASAEPAGRYAFPQGLASGDPGPESVVLWTRVERTDGGTGPVEVLLEVARDAAFRERVVERTLTATAQSDHTLRVIVDGLEPDTRYVYRFRAGSDETALLGHTRTAPPPDADRPVRLAFAACQSYEAGYYHAWRTLVERDEAAPEEERLDFVLHLGDFIYEALGYGAARELGPFPSGGGRVAPAGGTEGGEGVEWASTHAVTLEDYRYLWKAYLSDPDLMAARARFPFVMTWDDHEFTDDSWQGASTYGGPSVPAQERKVAANQAWFEFAPAHLSGHGGSAGVASQARDFEAVAVEDAPFQGPDDSGLDREPNNRAAVESLTIYRSFRWGRHVELVVTDLRSYRTEHALPHSLNAALGIPARYLAPLSLVQLLDLGANVPGGAPEALPLGDGSLPNPRAENPTGTLLGPRQKAWWKEVMAGSDATWKVWANSVPLMPMRLDLDRLDPEQPRAVLSTDTWDGYLAERRELTEYLVGNGIRNVVSLSGDNHNTFAGLLLRDFDAETPEPIGAEFSIAGISSPSVFRAFRGVLAEDDPLRALVVREGPDGTVEPALNMTFLHGTVASATTARTGDAAAGIAAAPPTPNPHLRYVDSDAYGIGLARVDGEGVEVEMITLDAPVEARREAGTGVLRSARFRMPVRREGEAVRLEGPEIDGVPPYPMGVG